MDIIEKAFLGLFPDKKYNYSSKIRYSAAFNDYNANIKYYKFKLLIVISLSNTWKDVSEEILLGLIQELLLKIFARDTKITTLQMELYHIYLKNTHVIAKKNKIDKRLLESFNRINDKYFDNEIEQTNLVWGRDSHRLLGRYEYGSDTIMISSVFKDGPDILIDKVMHHEMLHKKHKFNVKNGRCTHHSKEFRIEEHMFENFNEIEKETLRFIKNKKNSSTKNKKYNGFLSWLNG